MNTQRLVPQFVLAAGLLVAAGLGGCAPKAADGQSQVVDSVRFDYGLVSEPASGAPPSSHPDDQMHGGPPAAANTYHVVLSVADAKTGRKLDPAEADVGISGPGHPGQNVVAMEPMRVNGQASWGHYVTLPQRGPYTLEFRVRPQGAHKSVTARFTLERPA